ncbi:hypothetical protein [Achromobacter insuavis]|uniref:hypothetical protein n=1 Tax=Achromobacter insuavis TaxID=1287735 RepID=UPI001EEADBCC|nr:hypothetical protein [Achromobacter insuavis]
MELDRDLQRAILEKLAAAYPGDTHAAWKEIQLMATEESVIGSLLYLEAHGLLRSGLMRPLGGKWRINSAQFQITHLGLDFLQDDGGLSAVLGVVTIKFHDDTIKSLIEAKILQSDLPQPEKKRWTDQLRSLPAEATKHLVLKLVDKGLDSGPATLAAIGAILAGS